MGSMQSQPSAIYTTSLSGLWRREVQHPRSKSHSRMRTARLSTMLVCRTTTIVIAACWPSMCLWILCHLLITLPPLMVPWQMARLMEPQSMAIARTDISLWRSLVLLEGVWRACLRRKLYLKLYFLCISLALIIVIVSDCLTCTTRPMPFSARTCGTGERRRKNGVHRTLTAFLGEATRSPRKYKNLGVPINDYLYLSTYIVHQLLEDLRLLGI